MKKNILKRRRVVMATIGSLGDLHPYTPVIYAISVLDLKLVKWEKVEHTPEGTPEPAVAS
jgi:hypothetical protein